MRVRRLPGSIPARKWVRRWMIVSAIFVGELVANLFWSFKEAADEAKEYADQFSYHKKEPKA